VAASPRSVVVNLSSIALRPVAIGKSAKMGKINDNMKSPLSTSEGFEPTESNATATSEVRPDSVPKSWENPAIPIVSKLGWVQIAGDATWINYEMWFILEHSHQDKSLFARFK
jgi:hypothetical protein